MPKHKNHLSRSYDLQTVEDTQKFYSDWAATYDAEIIENGYITPNRCSKALASFTPNLNISILDIGCGTGLSGKILSATGFTHIDGCDINGEMLKVAKTRGIYDRLWLSDLDDPFPFKPGTYDAISAIGVIGAGAAPIEVFYSVLKKLDKDGLFVFSFNDHTLEDSSFEAAINQQIKNNNFELLLKKYGDHLPGRNIKANVYVMKKT